MSPVFSPDHKWAAFITNESGRPEAYVQAFEGGERLQLVEGRTRISADGVQVLRWRGDGKEIVYLGMDGLPYSVPVSIGSRPSVRQTGSALSSISGNKSRSSFDIRVRRGTWRQPLPCADRAGVHSLLLGRDPELGVAFALRTRAVASPNLILRPY
jgi:hypothetical protein